MGGHRRCATRARPSRSRNRCGTIGTMRNRTPDRDRAGRVRRACTSWLGRIAPIVLAVLAVLAAGCITPPAIPAAGLAQLDPLDFPPGSELLELPAGDGRVLRGVFVPAGMGAPVVLLLPGAAESISPGCRRDLRVRAVRPSGEATLRSSDSTSVRVDIRMPTDPDGPPRLEASAQLGAGEDRFRQSVGFQGLAVDLAHDLGDRELSLGWHVLDQLSSLGLACLCVDFGGVGASSGERDADRLVADALVAFDAALRRAGGDPGRVVLRGHSLGSLAAGALLARSPAAVVLVAPVRGETVVAHFADWTDQPWWRRALLPLVASVSDVDLIAALEASTAPTRIYLSDGDALLDDGERLLFAHTCDGPGDRLVPFGAGHEDVVLSARSLLPGEGAFYRALFPDRPPVDEFVHPPRATPGAAGTPLADPDGQARARLRDLGRAGRVPGGALAATLALDERGPERRERLLPWLVTLPAERLAALDLDAAQALLDLSDAGGALEVDTLRELGALLAGTPPSELPTLAAEVLADAHGATGLSMSTRIDRPESSVSLAAAEGRRGFELRFGSGGVVVERPAGLAAKLLASQLDRERDAAGPRDPGEPIGAADAPSASDAAGEIDAAPASGTDAAAARRALRRLLKAAGVPDRVAPDGPLLAWRDGAWLPFPDGW